ncbi:MAG: type III polyketide synthase [Candidatus Methylomirabilales bacterium]
MATPRIVGVATAVPPNRFSQEELLRLAGYDDPFRRSFFLNSGIRFRHLYLDRGFVPHESVDELNRRARKGALELGGEAIVKCLTKVGAASQEIEFLATTTCTVSLCPQLDTLFIKTLKLKPTVQRVHVGDTGCASALVALQAACNHLQAYPAHQAVVLSVEICSAAYFRDGTPEAAVGEALFADGAAALYLATSGEGVEVVSHRTLMKSEYLELMGFDFPGGRRRLVLSKDIREVGASMLKELIEGILEAHHLKKEDIRFWILHSAGRRVLENVQALLDLTDEDLAFSRAILRDYGNMSSATVLFVLEQVMASKLPKPGDLGVMAALGPGFAAEGALLRWP